jgi:hypothetical protein
MTDETDSTPRRRPPTIELEATEVAAEKPAAEKPAAEQAAAAEPDSDAAAAATQAEASTDRPSGGASGGSARLYLLTAVAGIASCAVGIAAIGAGLWFAGTIPDRAGPPAPNTGATVADISARLKKLESAGQSQPAPAQSQPGPALAARLAGTEAATKSLSDQLAALNRHLDEVAGAAQDALSRAKGAAGAAAAATDAAKSAAQGGVARGDLDALAARMTSLESAVKKLTGDVARQTAIADDRALRLALASATLRAAVERSAPYGVELSAAKSLGADPAAVAALEPFAASGVPSAASLAHDLAALMPALQQAVEPTASNATFLDRLEKNAQRLVRVTPAEAPAGDDPATVVTRIGVDAAHADLAAALADISKLPDAAKPVAAAFVQKVQARNTALAASIKLAADTLQSLGKPQ